jgi:signal transduction histidine kinase
MCYGPGVAEADVARLFDPFFTTKKQGEGTGIGLTMCRSILEAHGGGIVYRPNPGGGAAFVVRLPVDPAA